MTSIIGILCRDGVVVGADSAATFGPNPAFKTIEQPTEKINIIGGRIIVAGTGAIGFHQRFSSVVERAYEGSLAQTIPGFMGGQNKAPATGKVFVKDNPLDIARILSRAALEDMDFTYMKLGGYGSLVAFACRNEPHLCEFQTSDFQPELKDSRIWYTSMGSAQLITDPFLGFIRHVFWQSGRPSVSEGIFAATWTLQHAIELNPGGVQGPVRIAVLEKGDDGKFSARLMEDSDLAEHRQNILDAQTALRDYRKLQQQTAPAEEPPTLE